MKFEKISESQIKCTLNKKDLSDREIKISEFAYGSEKARELFGELMNKAYYELGFEVEDMPLMIEAIPISKDSIVLIVTKVESPDELDTRFSNFTPYTGVGEEDDDDEDDFEDELFANYVKNMSSGEGGSLGTELADAFLKGAETDNGLLRRVYSFDSIDVCAEFSHAVSRIFHGESTLYKNSVSGRYYLTINLTGHRLEACNSICNTASDFAQAENFKPAACEYYKEHFEVVIYKNAIDILDKYY